VEQSAGSVVEVAGELAGQLVRQVVRSAAQRKEEWRGSLLGGEHNLTTEAGQPTGPRCRIYPPGQFRFPAPPVTR